MNPEELKNKKDQLKEKNKVRVFAQKYLKNLLGEKTDIYNKSSEEDIKKMIDDKLEKEEDKLAAKDIYNKGKAVKGAVNYESKKIIKDLKRERDLKKENLVVTEEMKLKSYSSLECNKKPEIIPETIQKFLDLKLESPMNSEGDLDGQYFRLHLYGESKSHGSLGMSYSQGYKVFRKDSEGNLVKKEVFDSGLREYRNSKFKGYDNWQYCRSDFKIIEETDKEMKYGYRDGEGGIHINIIDKQNKIKEIESFNKKYYDTRLENQTPPKTIKEFSSWVARNEILRNNQTSYIKELIDTNDFCAVMLLDYSEREHVGYANNSIFSDDNAYKIFCLKKDTGEIVESGNYNTNGGGRSGEGCKLSIEDIRVDDYKNGNLLSFDTRIASDKKNSAGYYFDERSRNFLVI